MPKPNRYFLRAIKYSNGSSAFDVIDRQTGKSIMTSPLEGRARAMLQRLNKSERAYPGGFNKRTT